MKKLIISMIFLSFFGISAKEKERLAIMDVQNEDKVLSEKTAAKLTDYIFTRFQSAGIFWMIPKSDRDMAIQQAIDNTMEGTRKECVDEKCQLSMTAQLQANYLINTEIKKLYQGTCQISIRKFDVEKRAGVEAWETKFDCSEKGAYEAVDSFNFGGELKTVSTKEPAKKSGKKPSADDFNTADLYNKARDKEATDKERAIELYNDIIESSDNSDKYYVKAQERLIKLGDTNILRRACEEDNTPEACHKAGTAAMKSKNYAHAAEYYKKACDQNDGGACYGLAELYFYGSGVAKNTNTANVLYTKSCEKGTQEGCRKKGVIIERYLVSAEVAVDTKTNFIWQRGNGTGMKWEEAKTYCENLVLGGYSDWRLPTISELRTIIKGCAATETGGVCAVTDKCLDYGDCFYRNKCLVCDDNKGLGENGFYWQKGVWEYSGGQYWWFWSSSARSDYTGYKWYVSFSRGGVYYGGMPNNYYVKCVR